MFLLLISIGCCLAEGIPSTELKQMSEIVKQLEEKIDNQEANIEKLEKLEEKIKKQDAVIKELHRDVSELRTQNLELVEEIKTRSNRTEEALKTIKDTALLSAPADKAVRDLPFIMMCAYKGSWTSTSIIP